MTDIVDKLRAFVACEGGDLADVAEAADEIERLRLDAARYRWLRENGVDAFTAAYYNHPSPEVGPAVDAAVDAAMKG